MRGQEAHGSFHQGSAYIASAQRSENKLAGACELRHAGRQGLDFTRCVERNGPVVRADNGSFPFAVQEKNGHGDSSERSHKPLHLHHQLSESNAGQGGGRIPPPSAVKTMTKNGSPAFCASARRSRASAQTRSLIRPNAVHIGSRRPRSLEIKSVIHIGRIDSLKARTKSTIRKQLQRIGDQIWIAKIEEAVHARRSRWP